MILNPAATTHRVSSQENACMGENYRQVWISNCETARKKGNQAQNRGSIL